MPQDIETGRIVATLEDGSRYTSYEPMPCELFSCLYLDASGQPYGLLVDTTLYRITPSPRLRVVREGMIYVNLGRRVKS